MTTATKPTKGSIAYYQQELDRLLTGVECTAEGLEAKATIIAGQIRHAAWKPDRRAEATYLADRFESIASKATDEVIRRQNTAAANETLSSSLFV